MALGLWLCEPQIGLLPPNKSDVLMQLNLQVRWAYEALWHKADRVPNVLADLRIAGKCTDGLVAENIPVPHQFARSGD